MNSSLRSDYAARAISAVSRIFDFRDMLASFNIHVGTQLAVVASVSSDLTWDLTKKI